MNDPIAILKRDHREVAAMLKTLSEIQRPDELAELGDAVVAAKG